MTRFRDAMDKLCLTGEQLEVEFEKAGIQAKAQTIRQFRLEPDNRGYRKPPEGWRAVFARLARARGGELLALADELEGGAE